MNKSKTINTKSTTVMTDSFKGDIAASKRKLSVLKRYVIWYVFASLVFLLATVMNVVDFKHNKFMALGDGIIFMVFFWQAQTAFERYRSLKSIVGEEKQDDGEQAKSA